MRVGSVTVCTDGLAGAFFAVRVVFARLGVAVFFFVVAVDLVVRVFLVVAVRAVAVLGTGLAVTFFLVVGFLGCTTTLVVFLATFVLAARVVVAFLSFAVLVGFFCPAIQNYLANDSITVRSSDRSVIALI